LPAGRRPTGKCRHRGRQIGLPLAAELLGQREPLQRPLPLAHIRLHLLMAEQGRQKLDALHIVGRDQTPLLDIQFLSISRRATNYR
jgi:hypothetical protein